MALRTSRLFGCCASGLGQGPMASQCGRAEQQQPGGEQDGPNGERDQYPVIRVEWLLEVNPLLGAGEKSATRACALACRIVYFHYAPLTVSSVTVKSDMRIMIVIEMFL